MERRRGPAGHLVGGQVQDPGDLVPELESAIETADVEYLREEIPAAIDQSLERLQLVRDGQAIQNDISELMTLEVE